MNHYEQVNRDLASQIQIWYVEKKSEDSFKIYPQP